MRYYPWAGQAAQLDAVRQLQALAPGVNRMRSIITSMHDVALKAIDALVAFGSVAVSFMLRLDPGLALEGYLQRMAVTALVAALLKPATFAAMGLYSIYWRYVGPAEVRRVLGACVTGSIALGAAAAFIQSLFPALRGIPLSVFLIDFLGTTVGVGLVRVVANEAIVGRRAGRQRV